MLMEEEEEERCFLEEFEFDWVREVEAEEESDKLLGEIFCLCGQDVVEEFSGLVVLFSVVERRGREREREREKEKEKGKEREMETEVENEILPHEKKPRKDHSLQTYFPIPPPSGPTLYNHSQHSHPLNKQSHSHHSSIQLKIFSPLFLLSDSHPS